MFYLLAFIFWLRLSKHLTHGTNKMSSLTFDCFYGSASYLVFTYFTTFNFIYKIIVVMIKHLKRKFPWKVKHA